MASMKLSVCVDSVFHNQDLFESMSLIHDLGFRYFEFWSWQDKDLERLSYEKERLSLKVSSICTTEISLVDSTMTGAFLKGLKETIEAAKRLDCPNIIALVGNQLAWETRERQHDNIVLGLKECVSSLQEAGITLLMEPLNTLVDHPGYYLSSSVEGFQIIEKVNSPHVKLLYDIYHQQISEGNLISTIKRNVSKIGHFHAAGNPGRHELDIGEIHYGNVLYAIEQTGYDGIIGLEYFPEGDPVAGLERLCKELFRWL